MLRSRKTEVMQHMRPDHINPYSLRKGPATHATTETTLGPSLVSVCKRGEWSVGKVLDCYWHFGDAGDRYLGRVLAGLNPNDHSFAILPPHFKEEYMQHEDVKAALGMMYGDILERFSETDAVSGFLIRCLASVVYHSAKLPGLCNNNMSHALITSVPLLTNQSLLGRLRPMVTTEAASPQYFIRCTGIPPHVTQLKIMQEQNKQLEQIVNLVQSWKDDMSTNVRDALEEVAKDCGQLTAQQVTTIFNDAIKGLETRISTLRINTNTSCDTDTTVEDDNSPVTENAMKGKNDLYHVFSHSDGRLYDVPPNFRMPKLHLKEAWRKWVQGIEVNGCRIRPLRSVNMKRLPKVIKVAYMSSWRPILKIMEEGQQQGDMEKSPDDIDIEATYKRGLSKIKERCSYLWSHETYKKKNKDSWKVSTW